MVSAETGHAPNLKAFLKSLKDQPLETCIEYLISLLKRRQIKNSRPCAIATAQLLLRVISKFKWTDVHSLLQRIQRVGQRLIEAQPREMVVGNIVRRVLGLIREEAKEDRSEDMESTAGSQAGSPLRVHSNLGSEKTAPAFSPLAQSSTSVSEIPDLENGDVFTVKQQHPISRPPLLTSHTSYAVVNGVPVQQSMFNLLSATPSPMATPPGAQSPTGHKSMNPDSLTASIHTSTRNLKAEIINGMEEIIDELLQVDDQIAAYAHEHIHSNEIILTHTSSRTVQKFLLKAATHTTKANPKPRKFTVIHAESYPNNHEETHSTVRGTIKHEDDDEMGIEAFKGPLTAAGITVILITDAAVFALMSRVNKVILATHAVIANGGLVAAAGARLIAKAAHKHRTPVMVVSGVYKLSPEYPFEFDSLIEYGDPGKVISYEDGDLVGKLEVENPLFDYVPPELVDLYITNLGAHAPSYLYRIVADHYKPEDMNFHNPDLQF